MVPRYDTLHFSRPHCFADFFDAILNVFVLAAYELMQYLSIIRPSGDTKLQDARG